MSNTPPSDRDHINPKRFAGLMGAFEYVLTGKQQVHAINGELGKVDAAEQIEALKQIGINDPPTITYVEREKVRPRSLNLFEKARYNRDSRRLRKYNEEWIKKNVR